MNSRPSNSPTLSSPGRVLGSKTTLDTTLDTTDVPEPAPVSVHVAVPLTVETLQAVQFRQSWKGYDTVEVDDFLDEVIAGVDALQQRVVALEQERHNVQSVAPVTAYRSESDESVRRTLVLAQRAADLVVSEAKSVADRIVSDARQQAARLMAVAQSDAERIGHDATMRAEQAVRESEAIAERMTAQRAAELQSELSSLVEEQGRRRYELDQLRQHVEATRAQLRGELEAQMRRLESLSPAPAPMVADLLAPSEQVDGSAPNT
jgi:DivIVA domain-containing protein